MFEQAFKNIDNILRKEAGCTTELDKIGEIFGEIKNRIGSGYILREIIDHIDELALPLATGKVRAVAPVRSEDPQHGQCRPQWRRVLAYVIGVMNMILHGIDAPSIVHTNTLADHSNDVADKDKRDIVLANPPFGGHERKEVQQNFHIRTGETAFLFLQHFIRMLKAGGRGAIVIKNTFLSNADNAPVALRKLLLESCNPHTVLDCPSGTYQGAGVKTVVLFFEKGAPTRKTWFYQLDPGRSLGKTNPLSDDDLKEFVKLQKTSADSPKSWTVAAKDVDQETFDVSVKNPNGGRRSSTGRLRRYWKRLRNWIRQAPQF